MKKIILVDSNAPFREVIRKQLEAQADFDLAGVGEDGYDVIKLINEVKPDVIILDIEIPLLDGLKTAVSLRQRCPDTAIIIIADKMDDKTLVNAVCGGVTGFLSRDTVFEDIAGAVRNVTTDNCFMSRTLTQRTFNMFSRMVKKMNPGLNDCFPVYETAVSPPRISRSELRIATFIGQGLSNRQISEILKLKEGTVRNYISIILQKTRLKHRTQIALYALKNGLYGKEVSVQTGHPQAELGNFTGTAASRFEKSAIRKSKANVFQPGPEQADG
jgi:DNA-binding NarL/FixJ family response regulator